MNSATLFLVGEICFCEGNLCGVNKFQPCSQLWTSTCISFHVPFLHRKMIKGKWKQFSAPSERYSGLASKKVLGLDSKKVGKKEPLQPSKSFSKTRIMYIYIYTYDIITYMKHKYMLGKMTWKGGGCQRPLFRSGLFPGVNCPHHPKQEGIQATWHQRSRHCCFSFCSCFCLVDVWGNTALVSCLWLLVSRKVLGFFVCSSFWCVRS